MSCDTLCPVTCDTLCPVTCDTLCPVTWLTLCPPLPSRCVTRGLCSSLQKCVKRRMVSGTFPSLPYVCHYDAGQDTGSPSAREQRRAEVRLHKALWTK